MAHRVFKTEAEFTKTFAANLEELGADWAKYTNLPLVIVLMEIAGK